MTNGQPERAEADPAIVKQGDARKKGEVGGAHATRGPESGDTSLAPGAPSKPGLPFEKLPVEFGRYRVEKLIGSGAMGAVYLATDVPLDRKVAIKVPKLSASGSVALLKRMEREAKALAQLDHPNICKVYDFDERQGVRYMALEYVEGETLKSLLQRLGRKRKPAEAVAMIGQLARALGVAHNKGVVHRDLKPENIMRRADGRLVIMDFGLNRQTRMGEEAALKTQAGTVLGTPAYMSPEQAAGRLEQVDQRSDIYALGVILYEMLTGELPFSGTALEIMGKKALQAAPSPLTVNPKIPEGLASICDRLLAKVREDRPATCSEVAEALKACDLTPRVAKDVETEPRLETVSGDPLDFLRDVDEGMPAAATPVRKSKRGKKAGNGPLSSALVWWSSQALSLRLTLAAAACVLGVLLGVIFLQTGHGTLRVEIEDPALSVRIAGETITVDNDGTPIRIRASSPQTLEVYQNGIAVETPAREVSVRTNEDRLVKVTLIEGKVSIEGLDAGAGSEKPVVATESEAGQATAAPMAPVAFGTRRYQVFTETLSWHAARDRCRQLGGRLAIIRDRAENEFVWKLAKGASCDSLWLGATDETREGTWLWADGTGLAFNNFSGSQPDNRLEGEHYLAMNLRVTPGAWADHPDRPADERIGFVCEWASAPSTSDPEIPPDAAKSGKSHYKAYSELLTWHEAESRCEEMGGHLVIVNSQDENDFLTKLASDAKLAAIWIGVSDHVKEGQWRTVTGGDLDYVNWDRINPQPNNALGVEHYGVLLLSKNSRWWDYPNAPSEFPGLTKPGLPGFICEWETSEVSPPTVPKDAVPSSVSPLEGRLPTSAPPDTAPALPAGTVAHGTSRFKVFPENVSWHEAQRRCRALGGRLAIIRSRAANDFVFELSKREGVEAVWLGATDEQREGTWLWSDDSGLAFNNFANLQPNNKGNGEHYLVMTVSSDPGEWSDQPDKSTTFQMAYVCEWEVPSTSVVSPPLQQPSGVSTASDTVNGEEPSGDDGWVSLFNGKDLTGWRLHSSQPGGWEVQNGILIGRGTAARPVTHLYTRRSDYRDFDISIECRINAVGNSGLYLRTSFGPIVGQRTANYPSGYEAQVLGEGNDAPTGSLFLFDGKPRRPVAIASPPHNSRGEWFTLNVTAAASNVVTSINGKVAVDYVDPDSTFSRGCIALQVHDATTVVEFRSIRIRETKVTSPGQKTKAAATFKVSPSGLRYRILVPGTGDKPQPQQTVEIHYEGRLEGGTIFDSSYTRNQPSSFPLSKVVRGVAEGLQLIGKGGKIALDVPPALAYGEKGAPPSIPPNARLQFVIELLDAN